MQGAARAEGAPPTVSQLFVDPSDEQHLALRSNFGLLLSRDAGKSWVFHCKAELGYQGSVEPAVAILNGGTLVLGLASGIETGGASGCGFKAAAGITDRVVDVVAIPNQRGAAIAVSVSYLDNSSRVWGSSDSGRSFHALGALLPHLTALSLGVSAASPTRVYLTGLRWAETVQGVFAVSDDGGKTFTLASVADSDSGAQPFIAAVSPKQADTVYLRLTGLPGRLRASTDAGRTFRAVLSLPGPLQGFAVSMNGDQVFASSLEAGVYRADAASLAFQRVACEGLPCLAATSSTLLGCGERNRNGFIVGRSDDGGQTFTRLLDTPCIAPAGCGKSMLSDPRCTPAWAHLAAQLDHAQCDPAAPNKPLSRACFADAGSVSDARELKTSSPTAIIRESVRGIPSRVAGGCSCAVPGGSASRWTPGVALATLLIAASVIEASRGRSHRRSAPDRRIDRPPTPGMAGPSTSQTELAPLAHTTHGAAS